MPNPTITILAHHLPHTPLEPSVLNAHAAITQLNLPNVRVAVAPTSGLATLAHYPGRAYLLVDTDLTSTIDALERMSAEQRSRCSVVTAREHPLALDTIGSTHVQAVVRLDLSRVPSGADALALLHAVTAAATSSKSYRFQSGEPYQALRVLQSIALNHSLDQISARLCISRVTVMSHLRNTLARQALQGMEELLAALIGNHPRHQLPLDPAQPPATSQAHA